MQRTIPAPVGWRALNERNNAFAGEVCMQGTRLNSKTQAMTPPHGPLEGDGSLRDIKVQSLSGRSAGMAKDQIAPIHLLRDQSIEIMPHVFFGEHRQFWKILPTTNIIGRQLQAFPPLAIIRNIFVSVANEMAKLFVLVGIDLRRTAV